MLQKLPDWMTSRWNWHVTIQLRQLEEYPSFKEFADFVAQEAEIACNPVTSFHALKLSEDKPSREVKRSNANAFVTGRCNFEMQAQVINSKKVRLRHPRS